MTCSGTVMSPLRALAELNCARLCSLRYLRRVTEFCWHELQKLCFLETSCHGHRFCEEQLNAVMMYLLNSRSVKQLYTDSFRYTVACKLLPVLYENNICICHAASHRGARGRGGLPAHY